MSYGRMMGYDSRSGIILKVGPNFKETTQGSNKEKL